MITANVARCPEHGLHGSRTDCHVCGGPVEQILMVDVVYALGLNAIIAVLGGFAGAAVVLLALWLLA